jgi:hypothetical protein
MSITNEKAYEHAREIVGAIRDVALDDCQDEAERLNARLQGDPNVSNEQRATLVCDCFCDRAEGYDIGGAFVAFLERFPTLGELV